MKGNITIFDVPTGQRCTVFDIEVFNNVFIDGKYSHTEDKGIISAIEVTPTSRIGWKWGAWRRFCVDTSVEIAPGDRTIWIGTPKHMQPSRETHEETPNEKNNTRPVDA